MFAPEMFALAARCSLCLCCRWPATFNARQLTQPLLDASAIPVADEAADEDDPLEGCPLMHHTTVALIPPDDAWSPLQEARMLVRDKGLWRWPPHANLLYPFVAPKLFRSAAVKLAHAASAVPPFEVRLRELRIFKHPRSATLWLHPEPSREGALVDLQAALQSAIPHADQQTAGHGGTFTAHFTVGQFGSEEEALAAKEQILAAALWDPAEGVKFVVDEVVVMARDGADGQFEPRWRIPLGVARGGRPVGPLERGETFVHMPKQMPEYCVREPGGRKKGRRGRRGRS